MSKTIELYNKLKDRIGEEGTVAIIEAFDEVVEGAKSEAVTKDYFERSLTEEIGKLNARITDIESRIHVEFERFKSENIKWTFLFWIGQLAAMAALFKFFGK
ncbi:MAG: hypothetical protein HQL06_06595 [Nitrospirae bacterium]|nr:hypothetical protein [Nitrospirota bacterium]